MSKPSKATLALRAQFPALDHWIVENLSANQLTHLMECMWPPSAEGHPMCSEQLAVSLWRAYKSEVIFELECRWGGLNFNPQPGPAGYPDIHIWVCGAIALYATAQPELLDRIVARERREIEAATGPAHLGAISRSGERRNRL